MKRYIEVKERISEKISRARYHEMISIEIHRGDKDVHRRRKEISDTRSEVDLLEEDITT
jgi:hypothetical protein